MMRELREGVTSGEDVGAVIEGMLRQAHTIKGLASLAGFSTLNKAAHWLETLLGMAADGRLEPTGDFLDVLEGFVAIIGDILRSIETSGNEGKTNLNYLVTRATLLLKRSRGGRSVFSSLRGEGPRVYLVTVTFDRVKDKIPSWLFSVVSRLQSLGEIVELPEDVDEIMDGSKEPRETFEFKVRTTIDPVRIRDLLLGSDGVRNVEVTEGEGKGKVLLVRVYLKEEAPLKAARALLILDDIKELGRIVSVNPPEGDIKSGILLDGRAFEVLVETSEEPRKVEETIRAHVEVEKVEIMEDLEPGEVKARVERGLKEGELQGKHLTIAPSKGEDSIRVKPEALDRLLSAIEDLMVIRDWLREVADSRELKEISSKLDESFSKLRTTVLGMRMVSLRETVEPLIPAVERLAEDLGKEVEVVVEGEDVKVDRGVVGVLLEALVHILKNAVVHGIELPEERIRKGKPRRGVVRIAISQHHDHVEVSVSDDGRGIDLERIKERAVERGLVTPEVAERLSEKEALNLLFLPGMSSERVVSENAGRGIGLNVVWEAVRSVHGSITVDTEREVGTTFTIRVPFEMSVLFAYLLNVGGNLYALPSPGVVGEVEVERALVRKVGNGYLTVVGGEVLPALMLHDLVDFTAFPGERLAGVIFDAGKARVLILADGVEGKREIVVRPLRKVLPPSFVRGGTIYSGVALLGGRQVVPVVDPLKILEVLGYGLGEEP